MDGKFLTAVSLKRSRYPKPPKSFMNPKKTEGLNLWPAGLE
jgi:hypothetical protein